MHLSGIWSSHPFSTKDTGKLADSAPGVAYTPMSKNDHQERESAQSTTLFSKGRSSSHPAFALNDGGMANDQEKADNAGSRRQTQTTHIISTGDGQPPQQPHKSKRHVRHRLLTPAEWERVARGIGGLRDIGDGHVVVHPTCWYWPPKGLPEGLYRDTVMQKTKNYFQYHVLACIRWTLMISQIILGAILTSLGSLSDSNGTPITILAALNTVDAGLLALMHNSGIPERYRFNRVEFSKVEDTFRVESANSSTTFASTADRLWQEILDSGVVEQHQTVDEILSDCFDKFQVAKASVNANMPSSYTPQESQRKGRPGFTASQGPDAAPAHPAMTIASSE